jgi:hypothetical protein
MGEQIPLPSDGAGMPNKGTFSHVRSSLSQRALLPHLGLADAITPDQISVAVNAA